MSKRGGSRGGRGGSRGGGSRHNSHSNHSKSSSSSFTTSGSTSSSTPSISVPTSTSTTSSLTASLTSSSGSSIYSSTSSSSTSPTSSSSIDQSVPIPASIDTDYTRTHPLQNEWTLWYDQRALPNQRARGEKELYESNLHEIGTCSTVEDFWRYYNHIVPPTRMIVNSNYHFFKRGIKPMWEDAANANGGKWILQIKTGSAGGREILDKYWENTLLALIGETLDVEDDICGVVISRRKGNDKIALWNRKKNNDEVILEIGRKMRMILDIQDPSIKLGYQCHEDSLNSGASYTNPNRFTL